MNTNLMEDVGGMINPAIFSKFTGALGTSPSTASEATRTGVATLIGGLGNVGRTELGANRLMDLIHSRHYDEALTVERLGIRDPGALEDEGKAVLPAIFGDKLDSVVNGVGAKAHVPGSTASELLSMLTPFVLGAVGKHMREDHLDGKGLSSMLGSQRSNISGLVPDSLGINAPAPYVQPTVRRDVVRNAAYAQPARRSMNWLWALLPLAALAILLFYVFRPGSESVKRAPRVEKSQPVAVLPPAPAPALTVLDPSTGLDGFSQALASTDVKLPAAFVIDGLNFENGSAALPVNQSAIGRITDALMTSPTARVRIVGYNDSEGSTAGKGQLSKDRASAVQQALIDAGISADRIEVQGDEGSAATNESAADRAGNRRSEIVLLQR